MIGWQKKKLDIWWKRVNLIAWDNYVISAIQHVQPAFWLLAENSQISDGSTTETKKYIDDYSWLLVSET